MRPTSARKPAEAAPRRMGTLATLPVFLPLAGRRVVVAGGTAAAAWKCELVAAAGAIVDVYADALAPEMSELLARADVMRPITHHARSWLADDLGGAALALADAEDDTEANAFFDAARARGVPVNVIDRPAFCQFQFGSIVNRSPVVIGISTDGTAPILAQAIRRRIEASLPPALAAWGELARTLRSTVLSALPKGMPRRAFWEAFSQRAFAAPPRADERQRLGRLISAIATERAVTDAGTVTLVGAGPGDAELLTLKAVRALQSADVILFDDLVADEVLELARREATRVRVGKRGRRESCAQGDINELMITHARQGRRVVRLKCGDPMIFGRAGEEIAALAQAGIAVDIVPGVTTALAAAARLGVSLTHRDHAQSVRFVTGHARTGELPRDLDWRGLADPRTTLIVYMGGRTAGDIAARLIAEGLDAATPAIVAAGVAAAGETRWSGRLDRLVDGVAAMPAGLPCVIGIGHVFGATVPAAMQTPAMAAVPELAGA